MRASCSLSEPFTPDGVMTIRPFTYARFPTNILDSVDRAGAGWRITFFSVSALPGPMRRTPPGRVVELAPLPCERVQDVHNRGGIQRADV